MYLVCERYDSNVDFVLNIWEDRNISVKVIEANPIQAVYNIDVDGKISLKRRILDIWASAIGWEFSAPLYRIQQVNNLENFSKRSDHDFMVKSGETHFTKPYTDPEMFITMTRAIASDKEVTEAWQQLGFYAQLAGGHICIAPGPEFGAFVGNPEKMQEWLMPDYILCKECRRPIKLHLGDNECRHCEALLEEDVVLNTYYEDSFDDEF